MDKERKNIKKTSPLLILVKYLKKSMKNEKIPIAILVNIEESKILQH